MLSFYYHFKNEKVDFSQDMKFAHKKIQEGDLIVESEIENILKLILREKLWCKLVSEGKLFIHFGYDFYMYIGC
jgi:hypothetical protein